MVEYSDEATAAAQIANSDIAQELSLAAQLIIETAIHCRIPEIEDVQATLDRKVPVVCNVNSHRLNGKEGFMGHFVLATGYENELFS